MLLKYSLVVTKIKIGETPIREHKSKRRIVQVLWSTFGRLDKEEKVGKAGRSKAGVNDSITAMFDKFR